MVNRWCRPWLWLPVHWAHHLSPKFLKLAYNWRPVFFSKKHSWQTKSWQGLNFRNPVGTAGGLDKNAENVPAWWYLGAGFVEIGTVTPLAQKANIGSTVARDLKNLALWNCLGFPNHGAKTIKKRLAKLPQKNKRPTPVFVNIGKNRWTSNEEAPFDYSRLLEDFHLLADAFVINISSPNTKGLRDLFHKDRLLEFLKPVIKTHKQLPQPAPPLILKLSPDLTEEQLKEVILAVKSTSIRGLILTNTTQARDPALSFPKDKGGVSGAPLASLSKKTLSYVLDLLGKERPDFLVISVGGVMSKADIDERLALGADLVQVYSTLIFEGLGFFTKIRK